MLKPGNNKLLFSGVAVVVLAIIGALTYASFSRLQNSTAARIVPPPLVGDAAQGKLALGKYGCAACHFIPGIKGRQNLPGPPLTSLAYRTHIAGGHLVNTADNMAKWVINPPAINPRTAMPNVGVTPADAQDIAAYLYK